jgi:hypothetical protein
MMIRYAIALVVVLIVGALISWAFIPARYLPGNRVSYLRLRQHPGRGFASIAALWLRWGRLAAWRRSGRIRPSCHRGSGSWPLKSTPCSWGGRSGGTGCTSRWKSTCW